MTYGTKVELIYSFHVGIANLTHQDRNTSIDELQYWWNIHLVTYDTVTSRAKPSSTSELSYCSWSFGICDKFHQYMTRNSVGSQFVTNARIVFNFQVTATPGLHWLNDWWYQTLWLFSGASDNPEDDTVMEKHGKEALYSAVKSLMQAIHTEDKEAEQDAVHQMIQIAKRWTIKQWYESKLASTKPVNLMRNANAPLIDVDSSEERLANLTTQVERYSSRGALGAWRVDRWWLVYFSLMLGDTEHYYHICGQFYCKWPLDTWLAFQMFRWLRVAFLPMLVNENV